MIPQWKTLCSYRRFRILRLCHLSKFLIPGHKSGHLVRKAVKTRKLAAYPVIIAGQCQKRHDRTIVLEAVFVMRDRSAVFIDTHGAALMNHTTGRKHLLIRHAGQTFNAAFVKLLCILFVFRKAVYILFNIIRIDPALFDENISHAECQSPISARIRAKIQITQTLHGRGDLRINDDDLHALFAAFFNRSCLGISGKIRIHSPA